MPNISMERHFAPAARRKMLSTSHMRLLGAVSLVLASITIPGAMGNKAWAANAESTEYFKEAQQALKDGNANEAFIHLKNAVRSDPDNVEARFLLGEFNFRRGDIPGAEKEFREARRRGLDNDKVLLLFSQALLAQGKSRELLAEITTDKLQGSSKGLAHSLRARAHLAENNFKSAKEELDLARPLAGDVASFHTVDAEALQREGNYVEAENAVDRALKIDPKYNLALWLKGELRRAQKDLPGALEAYNTALAADENSMQVLISRAFVYLGLNRFEEAEADTDAVLKRAPEMPMGLYIKAVLLSQRGETEKALETLAPVEFRMASFMPAVYLLANLNLRLERLEGALSYAERYMAANENKPEAIKLVSAVYMRQKRFPESLKILKPHEEEEAYKNDINYLQLLGNTYLAVSDFPSAARVFKSLQKLQPDDTNVREQLAITSLGMGEQDQAVSELEAMAQGQDGSDRVNLLLILTHMRNKEYVKAETAAANYVKQRENNAIAHNLLGSVMLAQDKRAEALVSFQAALKADPKFSPAVLNLSQLQRMEKKPEEAKALLKAHLEIDKGNEKILTQLADIAVSEKDLDGALGWLQMAASENPKSQSALLRLTELQVRLNKLEPALRTATDLGILAPEAPAALNALAQVQILNKQIASGITTYRKLVTVAPTVPQGHLLLGRALMMNDNLAEARIAFDEAIKLAPKQPEPMAERITLEFKESGLDGAIKLAENYRDSAPEEPIVHVILGDVYLRGEKYAEASASFAKAQQLRPSGNVMRRWYFAQLSEGKEEEAFKNLQAWIKGNPEDWETRLVISTEFIRRGDLKAAISENEALNEKLPGRPVILNNLGWLYSQSGDPRGVEMVRTAYELAPQSAEIQDTYGWLLVKQNKLEEGLEILGKAAKALPQSAEVQYHYAAALARSGKKTEAREILVRILTGENKFDERKEAEALLETLKSG